MNARNLIGTKDFYKRVLTIAMPIMAQNGISSFVNMLDNVMVGQLGTEAMSGVSIVNQLIFVFNIALFGLVSGAGIYGAQFYGAGKIDELKQTLRFKLLSGTALFILFTTVMITLNGPLVGMFLHEDGQGDLAATAGFAMQYLFIMLVGLLPFTLSQAYAGTLRETGETVVPMVASMIAVFTNLVGNYILIFGHFGAPELGVRGAAISTVIARFIEIAIIAFWAHGNAEKNTFAKGLYSEFHVSADVAKKIVITGAPLFANELIWSIGMAFMSQCYSMKGLSVIAAINITNTINGVFNIVFLSMGATVGIIIGQLLGSGDIERARREDGQLIALSTFLCCIVGLLLFVAASFFPLLYNTTADVRHMATMFIRICGICMPIFGFVNATYYTLRSGGKTFITFLFDSCYMWIVNIPIAFIGCYFTAIPIVPIYFAVQFSDFLKCIIGFVLVKKGVWVHNLAENL